MDYSHDLDDNKGIRYTNIFASSLSLLGSLWMSWSCWKTQRPRTTISNLILSIALFDLIYSCANIMSNFNYDADSPQCKIEGFTREFSFPMSVFMATFLAIYFHEISLNQTENRDTLLKSNNFSDKFFVKALVFSLTVCGLLALTPLFFTSYIIYTKTNVHCYIEMKNPSSSKTEKLMILMVFNGFFLIIGFLISLIIYLRAVIRARQSMGLLFQRAGFSASKILYYPAVIFITSIAGMVDNILFIYVDQIIWVEIIHVLLTHSIGFFNALIYGFQKNTLNRQESMRTTVVPSSMNNI